MSFVSGAIVGSAVTTLLLATAALLYLPAYSGGKKGSSKGSVFTSSAAAGKGGEEDKGVRVRNTAEEDEIKKEQFSRNIAFFGSDGQEKVHGSFVVVIGLGGVGSHAAHMLARSGVSEDAPIMLYIVSQPLLLLSSLFIPPMQSLSLSHFPDQETIVNDIVCYFHFIIITGRANEADRL